MIYIITPQGQILGEFWNPPPFFEQLMHLYGDIQLEPPFHQGWETPFLKITGSPLHHYIIFLVFFNQIKPSIVYEEEKAQIITVLIFTVSEVSEKVIWNALVDDPVLFLRHFLEKLTVKDKMDKVEELLFLLRKLILHFQDLPAQMAHSLFNYLVSVKPCIRPVSKSFTNRF